MSLASAGFRTAERPDWLDPREYPFTSREIEVDGCRVHFVDEGNGPVLLMLHGNPTWSFLYRGIVKGLRDRMRCIAVDYPGFGLSAAAPRYGFTPQEHSRIVEQVLLALDLRDVTLMVQDWGGPIGLGVAGRHPDRFRGLVIGNTWAWPMKGNIRAERFSSFFGGPVGGFLIRRLDVFVRFLLPLGLRRTRLSKVARAAYRGPFRNPAARLPVHVLPGAIIGSTGFLSEVESGLERLKHLPALIVWGDRDPILGATERERFERLFPNHRTVILRGVGHFIQEEAPEEIVRAILDGSGK